MKDYVIHLDYVSESATKEAINIQQEIFKMIEDWKLMTISVFTQEQVLKTGSGLDVFAANIYMDSVPTYPVSHSRWDFIL